MTFGDECNCGNCAKYSERKHPTLLWTKIPYCEDEILSEHQMFCTRQKGCLSHPRAREAIIGDVVIV